MNRLTTAIATQAARILQARQQPEETTDVAGQLFERANGMAGSNPHEARELRAAANAWLRVLR
ncbi:MAG TPA: hypothetical protein VGE70_08215 [Burkholderiaceae bacterium]